MEYLRRRIKSSFSKIKWPKVSTMDSATIINRTYILLGGSADGYLSLILEGFHLHYLYNISKLCDFKSFSRHDVMLRHLMGYRLEVMALVGSGDGSPNRAFC